MRHPGPQVSACQGELSIFEHDKDAVTATNVLVPLNPRRDVRFGPFETVSGARIQR